MRFADGRDADLLVAAAAGRLDRAVGARARRRVHHRPAHRPPARPARARLAGLPGRPRASSAAATTRRTSRSGTRPASWSPSPGSWRCSGRSPRSLDMQADRVAGALAAQRCRLPCTRCGPGRRTALAGVPSVASPAIMVATSQSHACPASTRRQDHQPRTVDRCPLDHDFGPNGPGRSAPDSTSAPGWRPASAGWRASVPSVNRAGRHPGRSPRMQWVPAGPAGPGRAGQTRPAWRSPGQQTCLRVIGESFVGFIGAWPTGGLATTDSWGSLSATTRRTERAQDSSGGT